MSHLILPSYYFITEILLESILKYTYIHGYSVLF